MNGGDALRLVARARAAGRHLRRHLVGRHARRRAAASPQPSPPGTNILCMLPDTGERYLSTPLFESIGGGHDRRGAGDLALDAALPVRRAGAGAAARRRPRPWPRRGGTPAAPSFCARSSAIASQPVVMFALEWCEFCWSVRKLFARLRHPLSRVDLDSVELQARRSGPRSPRGARRAHRRADHPADLHRRRARRRLHRRLRRPKGWLPAQDAGGGGRARQAGGGLRPIRATSAVAASTGGELAQRHQCAVVKHVAITAVGADLDRLRALIRSGPLTAIDGYREPPVGTSCHGVTDRFGAGQRIPNRRNENERRSGRARVQFARG